MKLPCARFTVKRLMIAVAIVGTVLGSSIGAIRFLRHYQTCRQQADLHSRLLVSLRETLDLCRVNRDAAPRRVEKYSRYDPYYAIGAASAGEWWKLNFNYTQARIAYHEQLAKKYTRLAWRPGEYVAPDPPAPYWNGTASAPADVLSKLKSPGLVLDPNDKDMLRIVEGLTRSPESLEPE